MQTFNKRQNAGVQVNTDVKQRGKRREREREERGETT